MNPRDPHPLSFTPFLNEVAEVIGKQATCRLIDSLGGARWYVPREASADHRLAKVIGLDAMKKLCAVYGGGEIDIPLNAARHSLKQKILVTEGSAREVALKLGCSTRHVLRVRRDGGIKG